MCVLAVGCDFDDAFEGDGGPGDASTLDGGRRDGGDATDDGGAGAACRLMCDVSAFVGAEPGGFTGPVWGEWEPSFALVVAADSHQVVGFVGCQVPHCFGCWCLVVACPLAERE